MLGVKPPQINAWKNGSRNIPKNHKEEMYDIFGIPHGKEYLLEIDKPSELDQAEIYLILLKAKLKNYDINTIDDKNLELKELVRNDLLRNIKLQEGYIKILEYVEVLKQTLIRETIMDRIEFPDRFQEKMDKVARLADELKEGK